MCVCIKAGKGWVGAQNLGSSYGEEEGEFTCGY